MTVWAIYFMISKNNLILKEDNDTIVKYIWFIISENEVTK